MKTNLRKIDIKEYLAYIAVIVSILSLSLNILALTSNKIEISKPVEVVINTPKGHIK